MNYIRAMARNFDDLTPHEWKEVETAARAANAEIGDETLLVRSHVWPQPDGTYDWLIFVPDTLHRTRGTADSLPEAYKAMDACMRGWYPELTAPDGVDTWMTMARIRHDG